MTKYLELDLLVNSHMLSLNSSMLSFNTIVAVVLYLTSYQMHHMTLDLNVWKDSVVFYSVVCIYFIVSHKSLGMHLMQSPWHHSKPEVNGFCKKVPPILLMFIVLPSGYLADRLGGCTAKNHTGNWKSVTIKIKTTKNLKRKILNLN